MSIIPYAVNTTLATAYAVPYRRLLATGDVRLTQAGLLASIVKANQGSEFGREHGFAQMRSIQAFRERVPLSRWDDYASAVERIAAGEQGVLTTQKVTLLEPSSGSTTATKLVPYTPSLAAQFRAGIQPWLHDLYSSFPQLRRGRSYWSVTPAVTFPRCDTVVPIGFDDDADYLGSFAGRLMDAVFAVSPKVARISTVREFRVQTALGLLAASDLVLVSVWNPTFFTVMLTWMQSNANELVRMLPARRRLEVDGPLRDADWSAVWPSLTLISCWADANAARSAAELAGLFPHARVQPKGLLATEAMISVPIVAAQGAVFAARSHFVEFLDEDGCVRLADEILPGGIYEVVVTTGGGLYRYRLGDLVEMTGWYDALPMLRFVGRADKVSDLVGEKLSEAFVSSCLEKVGVSGFAMVAPETEPNAHYVVYTDAEVPILGPRLDLALRESFHYDYARRVGQLDEVQVVRVGAGAERAYLDACVARGQRLGDIKPPTLALHGGWGEVFTREE